MSLNTRLSANNLWVLLMVICLAVASFVRIGMIEDLSYTIWSDRDLFRASYMFQNFQFMGPELSSGGRTPGWFYYVILNALLVVGGGVPGAFFIMLAINATAMLSDESPL